MKNYHQLLAYIIKGIALVSLTVLATEPVLELTEVQARLEYSNFQKLISDFQAKLQNFDGSEQSVLERKNEVLLLLRNLQDYFHNLSKEHSLVSPEDLGIRVRVEPTFRTPKYIFF